jgi:16S rRNA (uracil1498-N3)-methyltransferase
MPTDLPHFYHVDAAPGARCTLAQDDARHAGKALRLKNGDPVNVTDGHGHVFLAEIHFTDRHEAELHVGMPSDHASPGSPLSLAIAPTKNADRLEWCIEKAVELGVTEIWLLHCDHSEKTGARIERLDRLALAALKQSRGTHLPVIRGPKSVEAVLRESDATHRFIAHCSSHRERKDREALTSATGKVLVLIGPEGDFSLREIDRAEELGAAGISLGPRRLRTETAAMAVAAIFGLLSNT